MLKEDEQKKSYDFYRIVEFFHILVKGTEETAYRSMQKIWRYWKNC